MDKITKKLNALSVIVISVGSDSERGRDALALIGMLKDLSLTWKRYERVKGFLPEDGQIKVALDDLTKGALSLMPKDIDLVIETHKSVKDFNTILSVWDSFDGLDVALNEEIEEREENRKSAKEWDTEGSTLTTKIKLTAKQEEALEQLDDNQHDNILHLGGSGSGKSFVDFYKIARDTLRYKAPCLVAREKAIDLSDGMINQIMPTVLQYIAEANGQKDWKTWKIDGLKFAKLTDDKTKLEFATGGYIRFGGLCKRDMSESGSDKILSPSWLHIMLEEVSEIPYSSVENLITRLRHNVKGVLNKLIFCENPPSIWHWSYKHFFLGEYEDKSKISKDQMSRMCYLEMHPKSNTTLSKQYLDRLQGMTGAKRERFWDGKFQDTETGEIFKKINWTDDMPLASEYLKIVLYVDPTPLTTTEASVWADFKACVLVGLTTFGYTYIIDIRVIKGSTTQMLQAIKQLWDISPNKQITEIWMEKKQVPSDFKQVLIPFQQMATWYEPIHMDTRHFGDKKGAIEMFLQPLFETETIYFNSKWRSTDRGIECNTQITKFSRKRNSKIHDDIPDAIFRADSILKGRKGKRRKGQGTSLNKNYFKPAYVHSGG